MKKPIEACYTNDLRKRCEELEKTIDNLEDKLIEWGARDMEHFAKCKMLEQAFDRACNELALSNKQLRMLDSRYFPMSKEDWKKELLKTTKVDN